MSFLVTALERVERRVPLDQIDASSSWVRIADPRCGLEPGWYEPFGSVMLFEVVHGEAFCQVLRHLRVSQLLNEKSAFEALISIGAEGVLGPAVCAELATDFVVWDSDATAYVFDYPPSFPSCFGRDGWEWLETYRHFARGFELAGKGGVMIISKAPGARA